METLLGMKGPKFVMLAADTTHHRGVYVLQEEVTKIFPLGSNVMMATVGNSSDASQFFDFMKCNMAFYRIRNGYELSPFAASHFARKSIADYRRSLNNYDVSLFIGGYDKVHGPELDYIDELANSVHINYGAMGYGSTLCGSIFDCYWHKDITQNEGREIYEKLICELQKRYAINYKKFNLVVVDENGIRDLEPILIKHKND